MRRILIPIAFLAVPMALGLGSTAAYGAQRDLNVTTATCNGVTAVASGMPANAPLLLLARDLATGRMLNQGGTPTPVHSSASGTVLAKLRLDLRHVRTVDVSIWTKNGETLTMMAKDRAATTCGALPLTGNGATGAELALGFGLLLVGAAALRAGRERRRAE